MRRPAFVRRLLLPAAWLLLGLSMPGIAAGITLTAGDLLVSDTGAGLIRVDPGSGVQTVVSTAGDFVSPAGVAVDGSDVFVVDPDAFAGAGAVFEIDPGDGSQTVVSSGGDFVDPLAIAVDATGDLLIADPGAFGGTGAIFRVLGDGTQITLSSGGFLSGVTGLTVSGGLVYAVEATTGLLFSVNGVGTQSPVSFFVDPEAVVANALGLPVVGDASDLAVRSVSPPVFPGPQTLLSSGQDLCGPTGLAFEAGGTVVVSDGCTDGGLGGVIGFDPANGVQSVLSSGGNFVSPSGIAVVLVPEANLTLLLLTGLVGLGLMRKLRSG